MKLATADIIKEIDRAAVEDYGMAALQLMENAGRALAEAVIKEVENDATPSGNRRVLIIAGKGNNGGDGYVAARHLYNAGLDVMVFSLAMSKELKDDAAVNARIWARMGGATAGILTKSDINKHASTFRHAYIIVDAIFGVGLTKPIKGVYAEVIEFVNSLGKLVVAADVPSGIDAETGGVMGVAIRASLTVTMAMSKPGLYQYPGKEYTGRIVVADIGAPAGLISQVGAASRYNLITADDVSALLRRRKADSHKGSYGHLLSLAGSSGKTGAACLCATGAMRVGAGLVTIALPQSLEHIMEVKTTEVMTIGLPETPEHTVGEVSFDAICAAANGKAAFVIGPGIGVNQDVAALIRRLLKVFNSPMVIDADGLNAFAGCLGELRNAKSERVLTPHPGEMARLLNITTQDVQADRVGAASRLSNMTGAVVVLKGAATIIAAPDEQIYINSTGNAGLATAGTGDVLSGMIGGFLSQGYDAVSAALCAVFIHGRAADEIKEIDGETGMMAQDLLSVLPRVIASLCSCEEL